MSGGVVCWVTWGRVEGGWVGGWEGGLVLEGVVCWVYVIGFWGVKCMGGGMVGGGGGGLWVGGFENRERSKGRLFSRTL